MPAFTFEKISPPRHGAHSAAPSPSQNASSQSNPQPQRDNVIQVLGRFVIARVRDDGTSRDQPTSN
jgi:hypothetical protein